MVLKLFSTDVSTFLKNVSFSIKMHTGFKAHSLNVNFNHTTLTHHILHDEYHKLSGHYGIFTLATDPEKFRRDQRTGRDLILLQFILDQNENIHNFE